jgi:putative endonuclease
MIDVWMKFRGIITVYVLRGLKNRKRYVGITNDLARRLEEHGRRTSKGGQMLGKFELVLTEEYPAYLSARAREKFLKSGQGRQWLDLVLGK